MFGKERDGEESDNRRGREEDRKVVIGHNYFVG